MRVPIVRVPVDADGGVIWPRPIEHGMCGISAEIWGGSINQPHTPLIISIPLWGILIIRVDWVLFLSPTKGY